MSGQPFTFPPPPPAPPQVSQSYAAYSQPQQGSHGYGARQNRGGRGRWDHARGGNRGGSRGGSFGSSHVTSSHGGYPMGNTRQLGSQNAEFGTQHASQEQDGYPLPNYPPVQLPQYPPNIRQDYGQQTSNFTQNSSSQHSQMRYPSHDQHTQQYYSGQQPCPPHGYGSPANGVHSAAQSPPRMSSQPQNFNGFASQPEPMGAAMRMGFQDDRQSHHSQTLPQPTSSGTIPFPNGSPNSNDSAYQNNDFQNFQHGSRGFQNPFPGHRGRGQKRGYGEAFGRSKPRPQAPPAVPSFGSALSLPVKPPAPQDHSRKSRKKKRKHNQLGLTPKAEEHESSEEEEDDVDEESKLAAAAAGFDPRSQL